MSPAKLGLLKVSEFLMRAVRMALVGEIALFFAATGLAAFRDVHQHKAFARVLAFQVSVEQPFVSAMKLHMPTNFKGSDLSRWFFVFLVYLLARAIGQAAEALSDRADLLRRRQKSGESSDEMAELHKSLEALARGEKLDRKKLLQIYADTKRTLEGQKRHAAFVSIDVVDSTGMKVGESPEVAERDFILYKKMVERSFTAHHALKSTWTPDGVMTCFATVEGAVEASLGVLRDLKEFNRSVKAIKHAFAVRIGINAGEVSYDDETPMEEMTDRVIDIAGHMQKHGAVDAVTISRQAVEPLLGRYGFKDAGRVVDGCDVFESFGQPAACP